MSEFVDAKTGQVITPSDVAAKLVAMGVGPDPEADSPEPIKMEQEESTVDKMETVQKVTESVTKSEPVADVVDEPKAALSIEEQAKAKGWKPDGPKSADEFLRAEPLYDEIKARGKEIKELKDTVKQLAEMVKKREALENAKLKTSLEDAKDEAIRLGDVDSVKKIEGELHKVEAPVVEVPTIDPLIEQFKEKHKSWLHNLSYEYDEMNEFFRKRAAILDAADLPVDQYLATLESDMNKRFPEKFGHSEKKAPSVAVSSDGDRLNTNFKREFTKRDLNKAQKAALHQFERLGVMTADQYIQQLVELGELKHD